MKNDSNFAISILNNKPGFIMELKVNSNFKNLNGCYSRICGFLETHSVKKQHIFSKGDCGEFQFSTSKDQIITFFVKIPLKIYPSFSSKNFFVNYFVDFVFLLEKEKKYFRREIKILENFDENFDNVNCDNNNDFNSQNSVETVFEFLNHPFSNNISDFFNSNISDLNSISFHSFDHFLEFMKIFRLKYSRIQHLKCNKIPINICGVDGEVVAVFEILQNSFIISYKKNVNKTTIWIYREDIENGRLVDFFVNENFTFESSDVLEKKFVMNYDCRSIKTELFEVKYVIKITLDDLEVNIPIEIF